MKLRFATIEDAEKFIEILKNEMTKKKSYKEALTDYDISALIGWYRCAGEDWELLGCLANISGYYAKRIVLDYLKLNYGSNL